MITLRDTEQHTPVAIEVHLIVGVWWYLLMCLCLFLLLLVTLLYVLIQKRILSLRGYESAMKTQTGRGERSGGERMRAKPV